MKEVILSILSGLFVGILFSTIGLPIPAPPVLPAVLGIVGVYGGSIAYQYVVNKYFQRSCTETI